MTVLHGGRNPYQPAGHQAAVSDGFPPPVEPVDAMEAYFECITTCSLEDGECVTRCVEELRERN
jgi:hypothetical protein